ncbi:hypothetical protein [Lacrimispora indolis]|uniref:hypothetical protein n=1 Tax=Lacrimispora indolis TaxID=69825 RepID=UPI00140B482D|nr:hypothetical protein [Lacrimispora indolis]
MLPDDNVPMGVIDPEYTTESVIGVPGERVPTASGAWDSMPKTGYNKSDLPRDGFLALLSSIGLGLGLGKKKRRTDIK